MAHLILIFGSIFFMNQQIGAQYSDKVYKPEVNVEEVAASLEKPNSVDRANLIIAYSMQNGGWHE